MMPKHSAKYIKFTSGEEEEIVSAFHKFFNHLEDPKRPNPKEFNSFIKNTIPQYDTRLEFDTNTMRNLRRNILGWVKRASNEEKEDNRGDPLIPSSEENSFKAFILTTLSKLASKNFASFRIKVLPKIREIRLNHGKNIDTLDKAFSSHYWSNYCKKNADVKSIWENTPKSQIQAHRTGFPQEASIFDGIEASFSKKINSEPTLIDLSSTECSSTNIPTPQFGFNLRQMEEEDLNGYQEEESQIGQIHPNQCTFGHQNESSGRSGQINFPHHLHNEETNLYVLNQGKKDSFSYYLMTDTQENFQPADESQYFDDSKNQNSIQYHLKDTKVYCSQEKNENLSNDFCWKNLPLEVRGIQTKSVSQCFEFQEKEQYDFKYDCYGTFDISECSFPPKEISNNFETEKIEDLLEAYSSEAPDICPHCFSGSKLRHLSKMKLKRKREACLCSVMNIGLLSKK